MTWGLVSNRDRAFPEGRSFYLLFNVLVTGFEINVIQVITWIYFISNIN